MICHHCKEEINSKVDYFNICRKSLQGTVLYFHIDCFVSVAGEEYVNIFTNENDRCRKCKKFLIKNIEKIVCNECRLHLNSCPKCGTVMVPKVNKRDNTIFLGCPNYPQCTKTQKF